MAAVPVLDLAQLDGLVLRRDGEEAAARAPERSRDRRDAVAVAVRLDDADDAGLGAPGPARVFGDDPFDGEEVLTQGVAGNIGGVFVFHGLALSE